MVTDELLLQQFVEQKQPDILGELVQRHVGNVKMTVRRMVHNEADADDVTQEVFLRAFLGLANFKGTARFSTWLHRIAVNTAHTFLTKRKKTLWKTYEELPEAMDFRADPADEELQQDEQDERKSQLDLAMAALSPKLRSALELSVFHGMETEIVADREGCSPATVYWRVHQARKILKERLGVAPA